MCVKACGQGTGKESCGTAPGGASAETWLWKCINEWYSLRGGRPDLEEACG
jgi:hypothetical protein